jgi:hypothetical protein
MDKFASDDQLRRNGAANMAIVPTSGETATKASLPRRIASEFIFVDVWSK